MVILGVFNQLDEEVNLDRWKKDKKDKNILCTHKKE